MHSIAGFSDILLVTTTKTSTASDEMKWKTAELWWIASLFWLQPESIAGNKKKSVAKTTDSDKN